MLSSTYNPATRAVPNVSAFGSVLPGCLISSATYVAAFHPL